METIFYLQQGFIFDHIKLIVNNTQHGSKRSLVFEDGSSVLAGEPKVVYSIDFNDFDRSSVNKEQLRKLSLAIMKSLKVDGELDNALSDPMFLRFPTKSDETVGSYIGTSGKLIITSENTSEIITISDYWRIKDTGLTYRIFKNHEAYDEYISNEEHSWFWKSKFLDEDLTNKPLGRAIRKWLISELGYTEEESKKYKIIYED